MTGPEPDDTAPITPAPDSGGGGWPVYEPPAQPAQPSSYGYSGGQPGYGVYQPPPPDHPQATTAMVLGIVSLVGGLLCGLPLLLGPVALILGYKARRDIAAARGTVGGGAAATAGFILGIIATVLVALFIAMILLVIGLAGAASPGT